MIIEFTIKENFVCISNIKNIAEGPLHKILDKYYKVRDLKREMQQMGVDFFPEDDAFCYIKGSQFGLSRRRDLERSVVHYL